MSTIDQTYDATDKQVVAASVVIETTATEIANLASKMPYCLGEDAQRVYDYLCDRFGFGSFRGITGIQSPSVLVERAIIVRAAAEAAATSQEVAA